MTTTRRLRELVLLSIAALGLIFIAVWTAGIGFDLVNKPDNLAVVVGVVLICACIYALFEGGVMLGKRLLKLGFILAIAFAASGCVGKVEPGYAGIQVNSWGTARGVQDLTITTGGYTYNPFTTTIYDYPTFVQTTVWTANTAEGKPVNEEITFTTSDQMAVSADISLGYELVYEKVPAFYVKFRNDDLEKFTHGYLRNLAREKFDTSAGKYKIEQIMGDNAPFLKEVRESLQLELDPIGVRITQLGFIGAPRPPKEVIAAITAKVEAVQSAIRVENQLRESEAEAKKVVATSQGEAASRVVEAEGRAKANRILQESLTPQLLEWRRLDIQAAAQSKWNGVLPVYSLGNSTPLIQLPTAK